MKNVLMIILFFGVVACKSRHAATADSSDAAPVSQTNAKSESPTAKDAIAPLKTDLSIHQPDTFRLVVSFISIGAGTDPDATSLLDQYLTKFTGASGVKPEFQRFAWGREGEIDNCFELKGMTSAKQMEFIEGLKTAVKAHDLIQIQENVKNRFRK